MSLADSLRAKAKERRAAATVLIDGGNLIKHTATEGGGTSLDARNLAVAIIGHVQASVMEAHADTIDYLSRTNGSESLTQRRQKQLEQSDAIRIAAARGDWAEFDRLAAGGEVAPGVAAGSNGENGGSGPAG